MESDNAVQAKVEKLTQQHRNMVQSIIELRRCVAALQRRVAGLEGAAGTRGQSTMASGWASKRD